MVSKKLLDDMTKLYFPDKETAIIIGKLIYKANMKGIEVMTILEKIYEPPEIITDNET